MNESRTFCLALAILLISLTATAQEQGVVKPQLLFSEIVQGMPKGEQQEVRVLAASFQPGDKTLFHTHRFPVTVYVLEGAFTMQMEGREPATVKSDQVTMMPPM
jgi:quercetin dioxygenase-like cupin family protein